MNTARKPSITLGVTGSIAAYKSPDIISGLNKQGFDVTVAVTKGALEFITRQTLLVMSGNPVISPDVKMTAFGKPMHIEVADHTDLMLIAPATARVLGKLASGDIDNPVSEIYCALPTGTPTLIAPAMNGRMLEHPSVQRNIKQLVDDGNTLIQPGEGMLACGYEGQGKLAESRVIVSAVIQALEKI